MSAARPRMITTHENDRKSPSLKPRKFIDDGDLMKSLDPRLIRIHIKESFPSCTFVSFVVNDFRPAKKCTLGPMPPQKSGVYCEQVRTSLLGKVRLWRPMQSKQCQIRFQPTIFRRWNRRFIAP